MYIYMICVSFLKFIRFAESDCILSLKNDFSTPQPVFLKNNKFLTPNATSGDIYVRAKTFLTVACPGSGDRSNLILFNNISTGINVTELECVSQNTFRTAEWTGYLKDVKCSRPPWFTVRQTTKKCYGDNNIVNVGYLVRKTLHLLYEACFNRNILNTLYVKNFLDPSSVYTQNNRRPNFIDAPFFGKIRMNTIYTLKNQKHRFLELLGEKTDEKYLTKNNNLSRGHLAPRADFTLEFDQRASFHYVNVAPQWKRGNQGDWEALEAAVRRRVNTYGKRITVYTGTFGVTQLKDTRGKNQDIYLHLDENGNQIVPVPMYYYKVVHDTQKKLATAFVSINNPYYTNREIDELVFCEDICQGNANFKWLKWRDNDATTSFCCQFQDFNKTIQHLPMLEVNNIFY